MKVKILNCNYYLNNPSGVDTQKIWISPDKKFAVTEVFRGGYYVAGKVLESEESPDTMTIDCIDCIDCRSKFDDDYYFVGNNVDWDYMKYGFCKLICWNIEHNDHCAIRIYFAPELYKQKYEELNGVPYNGQKEFTHLH